MSGVDIRRSTLRTYVNGQKVQEGAVSEMVWGIDELFADLTRHITLRPGDVVLTGTPWHSRPVFPGDTVEVEVDGSRPPLRARRRGAGAARTGAASPPRSPGRASGSPWAPTTASSSKTKQPPTAEQYRAARGELIARNMASGPPAKE